MTRRAMELIGILLLGTVSLPAQVELTGRIEGTVTDPSKAVVVGAAVTATHVETNTVYRATTTAVGRFVMPRVRLGHYTVVVEAQGFRRAVAENVVVEVAGVADLNISLQVGPLEQQVTVEAAQEIVNTVDAEIAAVVDDRRVQELPLDGRNASHLMLMQGGVFFERTGEGEGDKLIVHGQRHRSVNFTLDGIDTEDNLNRASSIMIDQPLLALAAENVQEFRVVTGLSSAEFGRGGIQIAAVTRSGSNDLRGSVFWFHRNKIFDANEFFNNSAGVETPPLVRNQFGGRIGGPIVRDKTFFYFGYQQTRESRGIPVNRLVYTAEARQGIFRYLDGMRTTPEAVEANPGLIRTVDLVALCTMLACYGGGFNPASPFDPFITGEVFGLIPTPNNFALGDGLNTGGFQFNAPVRTFEHLPTLRLDHRFSEKHVAYTSMNYVDRNIVGDFINGREPPYPKQGSQGDRVTHSKSISAALTSTFSPTFINEFRVGFLVHAENAFHVNQPFPTPFTLDLNTITDPYDPSNNLESRDNDTWHIRNTVSWVRGDHQFKAGAEWRHRWVHTFTFDEVNPFGEIDLDDNDNPPGFAAASFPGINTTFDLETARDLMNNLVGAVSEVEMRYNATSLTSGFVPLVPERRLFRTREFDAFFQDTWRVRSNLSLTLGLRWEWAGVPIETQKLALIPDGGEDSVFGVSGPEGFFNPGTLAGSSCPFLATLPVARTTANAMSLITSCATQYVPGGSNNGRKFWKDDLNNFAPVLGLAWDPWNDGKTSIRAGFRISYFQDSFAIIEGNVDDNEGLTVDQDCIPLDGTCQNNPLFLRDVLAGGPPVAPVPTFALPATRSILDSATQDFRVYANDLGTPHYSEWHFGIQREIMRDLAIDVRYVGNRGSGLRRVADFNEINIFALDPTTGATFLQAFLIAQQNLACQGGTRFDDVVTATCPSPTPNPLMAALIAGDPARLRARSELIDALLFNAPGQFVHLLTQSTTSRPMTGQPLVRGGSWWGAVLAGRFPVNFFMANPFVASARRMVNDGFSTYHALQIEARRRFRGGFSLQANYTFGKALADYDGDENTLLNDTRPSSVRNARYTTQEIMPRHLFNVNWIYELPFGPGKPFAPTNSFWQKVLEGWQTGGIVRWRSGRPISINCGVGTFHRSAVSGANTCNLTRQLSNSELRALTGRHTTPTGIFWLDPDATAGLFTFPNPGELGQLSQTPIFGPRQFNFDFSLLKRTHLTENTNIEFRWEVFNFFNNTNFQAPVSDFFSPSFGQILDTTARPREMQFGVKVNF